MNAVDKWNKGCLGRSLLLLRFDCIPLKVHVLKTESPDLYINGIWRYEALGWQLLFVELLKRGPRKTELVALLEEQGITELVCDALYGVSA